MAQSDFNENDYQNRQAGLTAWLNGAGNATPASPAYPDQTQQAAAQPTITPMQAFIAGQVAQQNQAAQNAGFSTTEVNPQDTTPAPNSDNPGPYAVAGALSKDSFSGGQSSQPQQQPAAPSSASPSALQSFMDSGPMSFLAGGSPFFKGLKDSADNVAAAKAIQNIPSNNDPAIATLQQQAMADPTNGRQYASALSQYMANTQNPEARTRTEESGIDLAQKKLAMQRFQAGMAAAAADAPGGSGQPSPIAIPQENGSARGQPMPSINAIAGAMNAIPNNAVMPVGGAAASPPTLPMDVQPAPASVVQAQPMTPLQQHIEHLRQQAAQGLIDPAIYQAAKDPTNAENQPKYTDHNGVVYEQKPGEKPTPYSIPAAIKTDAQGNPIATAGTGGAPGTSGAPSQPSSFGFKLPAMTQQEIKIQQENDKAAQIAAQNNIPIIRNAQRYLDALEPSLKDLHTGTGSAPAQYINSMMNGILPPGIAPERMQKMNTEYGNINSNTQSLALELGKLQPGQGSKGNKLALQTLINSKPGLQNDNQTNANSIADMRAKLADIDTSADLDQQYRAASPYGTTDANTRALDDALKTIYPLQTVDKQTGNITFNQHNADLIRKIIPDAIKRPDGYLKQAQLQGGPISYDPGAAAAQPTQNPTTMKTPSGIPYTVVQ